MFIISMYFFFNDTATPEIYTYGHTLSLHDALPIFPLAGLRWLRVLRVGTLLIRLQRLGLIDMRGWAIYGLFSRYYYLLIEELSDRSEEHTSELQSLMRISYAVFCLKTKKQHNTEQQQHQHDKQQY